MTKVIIQHDEYCRREGREKGNHHVVITKGASLSQVRHLKPSCCSHPPAYLNTIALVVQKADQYHHLSMEWKRQQLGGHFRPAAWQQQTQYLYVSVSGTMLIHIKVYLRQHLLVFLQIICDLWEPHCRIPFPWHFQILRASIRTRRVCTSNHPICWIWLKLVDKSGCTPTVKGNCRELESRKLWSKFLETCAKRTPDTRQDQFCETKMKVGLISNCRWRRKERIGPNLFCIQNGPIPLDGRCIVELWLGSNLRNVVCAILRICCIARRCNFLDWNGWEGSWKVVKKRLSCH